MFTKMHHQYQYQYQYNNNQLIQQDKPNCTIESFKIDEKVDHYSINTVRQFTTEHLKSSCDNQACKHVKILKNNTYDNCYHCGISLPRDGSKNFKSKSRNYSNFFSSESILRSMLVKPVYLNKDNNPDYIKCRSITIQWMFELGNKLNLSTNTIHLAVYLLDIIILLKCIECKSQQLQLYSAVLLLIAAKSIELDEKIPFISKIRQHADILISPNEFRKLEMMLLKVIDWNPIYATNLELLEFYLSQGIINSNDEVEIHDNNSTYYEKHNASGSTTTTSPIIHDLNTKPSPCYSFSMILKDNNDLIDKKENIAPKSIPELMLMDKRMALYAKEPNNKNLPYSMNNSNSSNSSSSSTSTSTNASTNTSASKATTPSSSSGYPTTTAATITTGLSTIEKMIQYMAQSNFEFDQSCKTIEDGVEGGSEIGVKGVRIRRNNGKSIKKKWKIKIEDTKEEQIYDMVGKIEKDVLQLASIIIKDPDFLCFNQNILATSCIAFIRKSYKLINPWNSELEAISSLKYDELSICLNTLTIKYENNFKPNVLNDITFSTLSIANTSSQQQQQQPQSPSSQDKLFTEIKSFIKPHLLYKNDLNNFDHFSKLNTNNTNNTNNTYDHSYGDSTHHHLYQPTTAATTSATAAMQNSTYANYQSALARHSLSNYSQLPKERNFHTQEDLDESIYLSRSITNLPKPSAKPNFSSLFSLQNDILPHKSSSNCIQHHVPPPSLSSLSSRDIKNIDSSNISSLFSSMKFRFIDNNSLSSSTTVATSMTYFDSGVSNHHHNHNHPHQQQQYQQRNHHHTTTSTETMATNTSSISTYGLTRNHYKNTSLTTTATTSNNSLKTYIPQSYHHHSGHAINDIHAKNSNPLVNTAKAKALVSISNIGTKVPVGFYNKMH